jgi:hypothetical protein
MNEGNPLAITAVPIFLSEGTKKDQLGADLQGAKQSENNEKHARNPGKNQTIAGRRGSTVSQICSGDWCRCY